LVTYALDSLRHGKGKLMKARKPLGIVLVAMVVTAATPASGELIKEHLIHLRGVAEPGYLYITESELSRDGTTLAIGFGAQDVISVDFAAYQNSGCTLNEAVSLISQASLATAEDYEAASAFYDGASLQYRLRVEAADYGDVKVDWTGTDLWHWESWNWFNVDGYIPEPGTAGLLALGLVMLMRRVSA
jgi:hypothetical protein